MKKPAQISEEIPPYIREWVAKQIQQPKIEVKMEILYCLDQADFRAEESLP